MRQRDVVSTLPRVNHRLRQQQGHCVSFVARLRARAPGQEPSVATVGFDASYSRCWFSAARFGNRVLVTGNPTAPSNPEEMGMTKVRVAGFSVSVDGFAAGPEQSLAYPLGKSGTDLFQWYFPTRTFCAMVGKDGGTTGVDDQYAQRAMAGFGAFILGRNMFGPIRGAWPDETWKGWWGKNPPYHAPTYILTHHARPSIELEGGTIFHFVTDGIESALSQARADAGDKDVKIGGGVDTVRQFLRAGLVDEMHLAIAPLVLGQGEALFAGLDLRELGFSVVERAATDAATHLVLAR